MILKRCNIQRGYIKADSHIACRANAVPLPCRAAKGLECVLPIWFTQCGRVWFTLTMPGPCQALTMLFSRPRHSTAVERRPVGYMHAFGFFRLPRGVPRRLLSEAYQSSSQRSIPTTVKSGSNTLQKGRSVKLLDQQFGYFRLPRGLSRRTRHCRSRARGAACVNERTAWQGNGMGAAWARHAMCESGFTQWIPEVRQIEHKAYHSISDRKCE